MPSWRCVAPSADGVTITDDDMRALGGTTTKRLLAARRATKATIIIVGVMAQMIMGRLDRKAQLPKRGHHRCGRLARALRPKPERTLVASDRMARVDVKRT
jgi:hypothetical protein